MANIIVVSVPESVILNSATIPADWARCLTQNDYNDVRQAVIKGEGQGKQRALLCSCVVSLFLCYPCMVRSQVDSYINRYVVDPSNGE